MKTKIEILDEEQKQFIEVNKVMFNGEKAPITSLIGDIFAVNGQLISMLTDGAIDKITAAITMEQEEKK